MYEVKSNNFLNTSREYPVFRIPQNILRPAIAFQRMTQAPGELIVNSMLSLISATFQGHYDVSGFNGNPIPLSTFFLAIAQSGEGKTVTQKAVFKPLMEFSTSLEKSYEKDMDQWLSESSEWSGILDKLNAKKAKLLADRKKIDEIDAAILDHKGKKPIKPTARRLITNDPTPAGLKNWLSSGLGIGLVQNADAGKLINGSFLQDSPLICDLWSGASIVVDRGNQCLSITDPRVSMSLMTQPNFMDELLRKNGDEFRGSGLSGRILAYTPASRIGERQFGTRLDVEDEIAIEFFYQRIHDKLNSLYSEICPPQTRTKINLSLDAQHFLINLSRDIEQRMAPNGNMRYMPEFASKFVEHTCRFAALFTLFEGNESYGVSLQTVQMASEFTHYFAGQYSFFHSPWIGPIRDIINANELLKFMVTRTNYMNNLILRTTIIQNAHVNLRKKNVLDNAIDILVQNCRIAINPIPGKRIGTYRMAYSVTNPNPILF